MEGPFGVLTFYLGPDRTSPLGNFHLRIMMLISKPDHYVSRQGGLDFIFHLSTHLFGRGYGHAEVFPAAFEESLRPYELLRCRDCQGEIK